jgi:hypothetical protein
MGTPLHRLARWLEHFDDSTLAVAYVALWVAWVFVCAWMVS